MTTAATGTCRPWTPSTVDSLMGRLKRLCNGCGIALGDPTSDELDALMLGRAMPDVRDECGCADA